MKLSKDKTALVTRHNKVVYDCGDIVAKVFNATKPSSDVLNEALNLTRAEQAGVNVPEFIEVGKAGNNWTIAMKKVEGKTLRQLMQEEPRDADKIMAQLVDLELDVHAHKAPLMNRQKDKYARMIADAADILSEAQRYELLMRLDGMPNHTKLCHGDFVPSNIIIPDEEGAKPVIVDWAHATQGNGGADCAITYLHLVLGGDEELAKRYLELYCERQGCSVTYIQNWMTIVAGAELARGRVVEHDYLLSMVDVVDYA
ncbi:MAG: aminoglycoside phosphotransferase family protein [Coriobacteriales bacterium]|nr:aminoglycoside phosphotransferase family protein [Coriobacteriales bacterium]